jgi:hypothetical protein
MNITSKILIPNKEWIIEESGKKIGTIAKVKKGYSFLRKGSRFDFKNLKDFNIVIPEKTIESKIEVKPVTYFIYDYPCRSRPYDPIYNVRDKLPLYVKNLKSKSRYCAGYYLIEFKKGWTKAFCPKLITLQRYAYQGPFKTEQEMKIALNNCNKS